MKPSRIALFGLGKMGLPLACALANAGHAVVGVDVNAEWVARINRKEDVLPREPGVHDLLLKTVGKNFTATTDSDVSSFDFVILLVPTLIEETPTGIRPDLHLVFKVAEKIGKSLRKGTVVITECTLPPGSTEIIGSVLGRESGLFVGKDFGMAHCPERTSSGTALRDICGQYPKIVGASDPETLEKVSDLYASINSKGVIRMPSLSAAECVKVFEGIYRDVNIGLANELAKYCQDKGLDAFEIFQAANTQPFCHLHNPSCGVGGHCIPYYPYFVMSEKTPLIKAARATNDSMPEYAVDLLMPAKGDRVGLLGLTFRGGVKEFRKSPALDILRVLKERGVDVFALDPLCSDQEIETFGVKPLKSYSKLDGIMVASNHAEFKMLDWKAIVPLLRKKVILDGCQGVDPDAVLAAGATYLGVGRKPGFVLK